MKPQQLAFVHLALSAAVLLWNLWAAGRAAQLRNAPRFLAGMSGLGGLLLLPALAVHLLSGSLLTGRAFAAVAWIWPLTVALVAIQAIYATTRGMVSPAIGVPIAIYDLLLALVYATAFLSDAGRTVTHPLSVLVAAERTAIALSTVRAALSLPWYLHIPIVAPCTSRRYGGIRALQLPIAGLALVWSGIIFAALPGAARAVRSYERFAAERLRERPEHDFVIGIKVFPTVDGPVPTSSLQRDLAIADSIGTQALCVYVSPTDASASALRSLAENLDGVRGERRVVVALDLSKAMQREGDESRPVRDDDASIAKLASDAARIAGILRPDYLVPVVAPMAIGMEPALWQRYTAAAARAVHDADPDTRVMAHIAGFTARDSSLYAWAASSSTPVDAIALTLFPGPRGALDIQLAERTIDRWLTTGYDAPSKEHWILEAGGLPTVHGELSQARALWGILAWSTNHPIIHGVIAFEASDYSRRLGLQTPSGRIRLAAGTLERAIAGLGE